MRTKTLRRRPKCVRMMNIFWVSIENDRRLVLNDFTQKAFLQKKTKNSIFVFQESFLVELDLFDQQQLTDAIFWLLADFHRNEWNEVPVKCFHYKFHFFGEKNLRQWIIKTHVMLMFKLVVSQWKCPKKTVIFYKQLHEHLVVFSFLKSTTF